MRGSSGPTKERQPKECMMQVLHFVIDKKHYEIVPFLLARMTKEAEKAQSVRHTSTLHQPLSAAGTSVVLIGVCGADRGRQRGGYQSFGQ